jgi:cellulose synthase/poly-beta-1,6-N-acetylglucosamine synthase-like glycosyltransferase
MVVLNMGVLKRLFIVVLFVALSSLSLIFSGYLLLSARDPFVYLVAILFTSLALVSAVFNVTSSYAYYRSYFYDAYLADIKRKLRPMTNMPKVAVVIPTYNEDPAMVKKNLARLQELKYDASKLNFYLLDDSTDPDTNRIIQAACKSSGATYIHRDSRAGFKAGALNNLLTISKEEFLAIFDSTEYLTNKNFLMDVIPYFQDSKVAFVQTEKRYAKGTFFSDTVDLFDALFFKLIQPSRVLNGTAIFAGSCGVIRRSALDAMGGFPEYVTEDTFFSYESDVRDFKGLYLPKIYALGKPIYTFSELTKQQLRYNFGDTQFLLYFLHQRKMDKKRTFSALSKIDYAAHGFGLNYLSSILILFTVVSVLTVFSAAPFAYSSIKEIFLPPYTAMNLELLGISAFLLSVLVPVALTKTYFNSFSKGIMLFLLNFALAFIRLKGAIGALFSTSSKNAWPKINYSDSQPMRFLPAVRLSSVELGFSGLLFGTSFIAVLFYNISGALWLLWYGILYSSTFFFYYKYG